MANGNFGGGNGSELFPYIVEDAEDLNAVRNMLSGYYIQANDIDMSSYPSFIPIGGTNLFTGRYDGNNKVIRNLTINRPEDGYVGLFGRIVTSKTKQHTLTNITIENAHVTGKYNVGILAGQDYANNSDYDEMISISNCKTQGVVRSSISSCGGIVGSVSGGRTYDYSTVRHIINCEADVAVQSTGSSSRYLGGIVGYANKVSVKISGCNARGSIDASNSESVGGILGCLGFNGLTRVTIEQCSANQSFIRGSRYVGGIVGHFHNGYLNIRDSYVITDIESLGFGVGGFVGLVNAYYDFNIDNCYIVSNSVSGYGRRIGGVVGFAPARNGYQQRVSNTVLLINNINKTGGYAYPDKPNIGDVWGEPTFISGQDNHIVNNVYRQDDLEFGLIEDIYGMVDVPYLTASGTITRSQGQTQAFYQSTLGWDFTNIWTMIPDFPYPVLQVMHPPEQEFPTLLCRLGINTVRGMIQIAVLEPGMQEQDILMINTRYGLGSVYLVEPDDPLASPLHINTRYGLKSCVAIPEDYI